jgi:hypothetical protein
MHLHLQLFGLLPLPLVGVRRRQVGRLAITVPDLLKPCHGSRVLHIAISPVVLTLLQ